MVLLQMKQISKVFGDMKALNSINLSIEQGKIHSLVGENGAGKSTLIKILTGVYQSTSGELFCEGSKVDIKAPKDAQQLGIHAIHQDRQLIPYFNGLENLYLNDPYPLKRGLFGINWRKMKAEAELLKRKWGIDIPLDIPAFKMTPSEQTLLEILRAMNSDSKILVLDEPTASLSDKESELLFSFIERLKNQGVAIIYISHRLEEVIRISDKVSVLTGGKLTTTLNKDELSKELIIHHMTDGEALRTVEKKHEKEPNNKDILLQVNDLRTKDQRVKKADFTLHSGEILGVYGLAGAGRTETLEAIYGLRSIDHGEIRYKGKPILKPSPGKMLQNGIAMIPENRHEEALIMSNTIKDNMTLPIISSVTDKGKINKKKEDTLVDGEMERFKIKATSMKQRVAELSGGNQQKVVFGKALLTEPNIYMCDEPTQAVDIMTRTEIHMFLKKQSELGDGVIFVSSDINEILEISDRVLVFSEGKTVSVLENHNLTTNEILDICYKTKMEGVAK
ncbi:ribose transport system ATP-binding protein [Virgibacillus subterraneus]|uniref:Ribose transport system ATP-binding protein n=1 Tax=Virgibacillus subterraneus TaxID=621109 RepID=A0A1H9AQC8_9BACI|nr:sugar ABC transporter ATP-binding protein [Virgibacillus subterraneus]SEP78974.1 ribose transport system ATP-binding protein [Virgibacillus subterraneus]